MGLIASNMQVAYSVCEVSIKNQAMASVKIVKSDVFLYIESTKRNTMMCKYKLLKR